MASNQQQPEQITDNSSLSASSPPSIEPEVALLLTNEETLCEKAITLLLKICSSIVQQPKEKRVRSLNLSSRAVEFTLLPAIGAIELLFFMGFQEANDRLVMPEDACLDTLKMYQQQLHLLLAWKTNSSTRDNCGGGPPSISASLNSLCPSNASSPASLRSNPGSASPRTPVKAKSPSPGRAAASTSLGTSPKAQNRMCASTTPAKSSQQGPSAKSTLISNTKAKVLQSSQSSSSNSIANKLSPKTNCNANPKVVPIASQKTATKPVPNANKISQKAPSIITNGVGSSKPHSSAKCAVLSKLTQPLSSSPSVKASPVSCSKTDASSTLNAPSKRFPASTSSSSSQSATTASSGSDASGSGSSSVPSSILAPIASVPPPAAAASCSTGATSKKIAPHKLRPPLTWLSRFTGYLQRVLTYEEPHYQAKARTLIPVGRLHSLALQALREETQHRQDQEQQEQHKVVASSSAAAVDSKETSAASDVKEKIKEINKNLKPFDFNDHLLVQLVTWFKRDFFRWFDSGWCDTCHTSMASRGTVPPSKQELDGEATTVEYYQCQMCGTGRRFPRYLNVGRLLETREGRCGEWASAFTLCCRTLGCDARQVFDETDHTWTEVWSQSQCRWLHVDPCEGRVDCPLLYECGWGKQLSYVVAASRDEVLDVTWRYTVQPNVVKTRRTKVSEEELCSTLWGLTVQLQQHHQQHTRHQLHLRMVREMAEFLSTPRPPTKEELEGRTSGSLGWRVSRGETGLLHTTTHHTFTLHHTARITTLTVKYSPLRDVYRCEGVVGPAELQGWQAGVHAATNVALKREHDWHNVYLARTEGESDARCGEVVWRVRWESARVALDTFHVILRHTLFHGATVTWGVTVNGEHYPGDTDGELHVSNLCSKANNRAVAAALTAAPDAVNANHHNNANNGGKTVEADVKNANTKGGGVVGSRSGSKDVAIRQSPSGKGPAKERKETRFSLSSPKRRSSSGGSSKSPARHTVLDNKSAPNSKTASPRDWTISRPALTDNYRPTTTSESGGHNNTPAASNSTSVNDSSNNNSGELEVRAVLSGGEGNSAWQHAQLFRIRDSDTTAVPFLIDLQFQ